MKRFALALAVSIIPTSLTAGSHFWIIGGGPTLDDSQVQIERNVTWVVASLKELVPDATVDVFFANGSGPEPATVEHLAYSELPDRLPFEALARVFGEASPRIVRERPHRVQDVAGSTHRDVLLPALGERLAGLRAGDQAMIVYNGHGSWAPDRSHNALRLWGESSIDVREFESLLQVVDPAVPVRFLFTQCYSGAFERAVHPNAEDVLELAAGRRCGFFAESADRQSEGCSASLLVGDYRDYTTYFFAALTGRTRQGEPVVVSDWDGDGDVTPFDAHLYALVEGRNADLPRSTSEVYLERWQPWYVRWFGTNRVPENLYGRAAARMAEQVGLPAEGFGAALETRYEEAADELAAATGRAAALRGRVEALQGRLQTVVRDAWPELAERYTVDSPVPAVPALTEAESRIRSSAEYADLIQAQDEFERAELEMIEAERDLSQLDRLRRTRLLARSLAQLERLGSRDDREAYAHLRACEALPLE